MVRSSYEECDKRLWKGHRLLAGDGSTLNLPSHKDIEDHFGLYTTNSLGTKRYLARTFMIYDVLNQYVVDGQLSIIANGEKTLLKRAFPLIKEEDILVLDRGFGNFSTIKELISHRFGFCVRLPVNNSNFAKLMLEHERNDHVTTWEPSVKEKENTRKNNLDVKPMEVRVIRIELSSGEVELLITNLTDKSKYLLCDMTELYRLRWGVEEGFKNLKPKMKIEQFGCKKAEGIFQEFYAHIFSMNVISLFGIMANDLIKERTIKRKREYKYNWKNAYRYVREKMIDWLFLRNVEHIIEQLLIQISSSMVAIIPDRQFARDMKNRNKKGRITQFNK